MLDFLSILLQISLLGTLLSGLLFLVRLLSHGQISQTVYYYLWILVLLRLCIPGGIILPLPTGQETAFYPAPAGASLEETSGQPVPVGELENLPAVPAPDMPEKSLSAFEYLGKILKSAGLWVSVWGVGVFAFLGWYIGGYLWFSHKIRKSFLDPSPKAAAVLRRLKPMHCAKRVRLAVSPLVRTPMLLGVFRPVIVLPEGTDDSVKELRDILSHEMVHARRFDLPYKWFAVIAASLHWFNPVMVLVRKEISRACELSCDEAAVRSMNDEERRHYGETLLKLAAGAASRQGWMAVTLCEEKRHLKQRLAAIAQYHEKGALSVLCSTLLVLVTSGCALFSGVEQQPSKISFADYEAFHSALLGETQIICCKDGGPSSINIGEVPDVFSPDSDYAEIWKFSVVDLDGDSQNEVVLQVIDVAGDMGGFLVLHWENGEVFGYPRSYREFESLKTDGTYGYSNALGTEWGVCTASFTGKTYTIQKIFSGQVNPGSENAYYTVYEQSSTERKYDDAANRQAEKPDAVWYEFTSENIEKVFSGMPPQITAPENTPVSSQISQQAAEALEADFREYWDTVKDGIVLPVVSVFQTNRFAGMENTVFVVYPTWRKSCTVIYSVNGNTVKRLGDALTGFDFALSSANGGMFRTSWTYENTLMKNGENDDNYYTVSPEGVKLVLSLGASVFEGTVEKGFIYQESGTVELTAEEYQLQKEKADRDFSDAQIISFVPADFGAPDTGFDISSEESFAEYILKNREGEYTSFNEEPEQGISVQESQKEYEPSNNPAAVMDEE